MMNGKKVAVVLPGLNVKGTLERTLRAIPSSYVDVSIFVDDGSSDGCGELAASLGCVVMRHAKNLGYGAGQKTGYREALDWQWRTLDRCAGRPVDRTNPDFSGVMSKATTVGE